jgi:glycosyltransferase involved in cell wall biosynthesis
MRSEIRVVAVGHLPIHFDSLANSLSRHFELYRVTWTPRKGFGVLLAFWLIIRLSIFAIVHRAVILIAQYAFPDGFVAAFVAFLLRRPYFVQVVGSDIRLLSRGLKMNLVSWALSNATGVICVSKDLEIRSKTIGARRTRVIPTPVDLSIVHQGRVAHRQPRLVTVANLVPLKAIDLLIRALRDAPRAQLIVIGRGPEKERLETLARELELSDHVRFTGFIPQKEVAEYLQSSSIFVLPSLSEGLPRSLLEAMACGMFIIATRVGGIPDVVTDGQNGFLIPPNDVRALSRAIRKALENPELVEKVGNRNKSAVGRYDVNVIGGEIAEFILKESTSQPRI